MGSSLEHIGLTSLYGLPWNLKALWSPLVDGLGTTRRWIVALEIVLALVIMATGLPAWRGDVTNVANALALVAILAATHDIAVDGFYLRALDATSQAALSGLRVAAYRVAMLVGNGLLVTLAGWASWRESFVLAGAILLVLALAHAALLPAEVATRAPRADRKHVSAFFTGAVVSFVRAPGVVVATALILLYRAGDALMFAMSAPFLKTLGLDVAMRGLVSGVMGTIASIAGSMGGGAVIAKLGLRRALGPIALTQSLAILIYVALAVARPGLYWIATAVVTEQLVAGVGSAAFVVFLMSRCHGEYKASHFAICTALMSVATTAAGSASGFIATKVGFSAFFALAFAASIPGVVLARVVPIEPAPSRR